MNIFKKKTKTDPVNQFYNDYLLKDGERRKETIEILAYFKRRVDRVNENLLFGTVEVSIEDIEKKCGWTKFCKITDTPGDMNMGFRGNKVISINKSEAKQLGL